MGLPSIEVSTNKILKGLVEYNENFKGNRFLQRKFLEMALDTRKFEIELYWKRATYFWAFIALAFGAYFMIFKEFSFQKDYPTFYNEALLAISIFGLFVSCCWFLVNKGAKYWQENWEKHVDLLEDEIMGPLYKTTVDNMQCCGCMFSPFHSYKYSVGKINLLLSSFVVVAWIIIIVNRLSYIFQWTEPCNYFNEIARLFTNLLTNASNEDRANLAHPSFVSMIERLSSDEARILNAMQKSNDILYCDFDEDVGGAYAPIFNHITAIQKYVKLQYPQNELAYLSNLESMGVLKDNFPKEKTDVHLYQEIADFHNVNQLLKEKGYSNYKNVTVSNGFYSVTPFGRMFIEACTMV